MLARLNAENKTRLEFIDWMHLKELYRLYRFLKNQTPLFNPDQEMPEVMMRMTDDVERRIDGTIDKVGWVTGGVRAMTRAPLINHRSVTRYPAVP